MNSFDVDEHRCDCGLLIGKVTGRTNHSGPRCGTLCICVGCGELYRFDVNLKLSKVCDVELNSLSMKLRERVLGYRKIVMMPDGFVKH